jgi:hypothetical protein
MWHLYWQNLYFKRQGFELDILTLLKVSTCLRAMLTFFVSFHLHSQVPPYNPLNGADAKYPGLFESFQKFIQLDRTRFQAKTQELSLKPLTSQELKKIKDLELDADFINSLMLHSASGVMTIAMQSQCAFYYALMADLLRTAGGPVDHLLVSYRNEANKILSGYITRKDFLNLKIKLDCPDIDSIVQKFQLKNLPQTLKTTPFKMPNNKEHCDALYQNWMELPETPYWCQVHELIKNPLREKKATPINKEEESLIKNRENLSRLLREKLSSFQQSYLANLCQNADNSKRFCENFFATHFFDKAAENLKPSLTIKSLCEQNGFKAQTSPLALKECSQALKSNPENCFYTLTKFGGLAPQPRCDHLSLAQNFSSLRQDYNDCPGQSNHLGVTNFARILNHKKLTPLPEINELCSAHSAATMIEFNEAYDNDTFWDSGICWDDKVNSTERCLNTFAGEYPGSKNSLTAVVSEFLYRNKGAAKNLTCELTSLGNFNPTLLQYKYGCFIVYDPEQCAMTDCQYKVFYNQLEIKNIKHKTGLAFDYFPTNLQNEKYSQVYIYRKDANHRSEALQTLPRLEAAFKKNPSILVHGIACAEQLYPSFFRTYAFNQCSPLPFIIDGLYRDGDQNVLIIRTAADNIHAPRLISWNNVFNAVKNYQAHHPIKFWTLYAIW